MSEILDIDKEFESWSGQSKIIVNQIWWICLELKIWDQNMHVGHIWGISYLDWRPTLKYPFRKFNWKVLYYEGVKVSLYPWKILGHVKTCGKELFDVAHNCLNLCIMQTLR